MGVEAPGVCAAQDLQMQCQSRSAGRNTQAPLSKMPSSPLPCSLLSEMSHRNVLPHVDLFLSTTGSSSLSPGTNILPAKALTLMWLNHPRIRTQTSWRRSLPPPSPLLSKHTWSWPMKGSWRPLPAGHEL